MWGEIIGGIGGIAGAIGGFLNNNNNIDAAWQMMLAQQKFNAEQAQITRDWQEEMRETSYQTAMEDMKKGGLNPLLVGNIGGAAMPGPVTASSPGGMPPKLDNWLAGGVTSAVELAKTVANLQLVESQSEKNRAEAGLAREQTATQPITRDQILADIGLKKGHTLSEEERRGKTAAEIGLLVAQKSAAYSAAGASGAAQYRDTMQGDKTSAEINYLNQHGAFPPDARGYSGAGFSVPPKSQLERDFGRGWDSATYGFEDPTSARGIASSYGKPSEALSEVMSVLVRKLRRNFNETSGRDPYQTPRPVFEYSAPMP